MCLSDIYIYTGTLSRVEGFKWGVMLELLPRTRSRDKKDEALENWLKLVRSSPESPSVRAGTSSYTPAPVCEGRCLCQVWLANGLGVPFTSENLVTQSWRVGVLLSCPVHPHNLFWDKSGQNISRSLQTVLIQLALSAGTGDTGSPSRASSVFFADVFPYTGDPTFLGASHVNEVTHVEVRRRQVELALAAHPLVLLVSGEAARDAVVRACFAKQCFHCKSYRYQCFSRRSFLHGFHGW